MNAKAFLIALFSFLPLPALAQGFAGLGTADPGFSLPDPDVRFRYPEDHGAHPDFRIEWWYVTAALTGEDGQSYGIQWTLFRNALSPGLGTDDPGQIWMAHAGLTTETSHFAAERFARGGTGLASVSSTPFDARIDEWFMSGPSLSDVNLFAQGADFAYDISLSADGPFVPQGDNGFSVKSEAGQASHYYSQPFYTVAGTLTLPSGDVQVTGQAWLDREWSSQPLTTTQTGWDWISLHLDGGEKLMGYRLRDADGSAYTVGTWITPEGDPTPLKNGEILLEEVARSDVVGRSVPTAWRVTYPEKDLEIEVRAINPQSWMDVSIAYWEGPITVEGTHSGIGYLEMAGYD